MTILQFVWSSNVLCSQPVARGVTAQGRLTSVRRKSPWREKLLRKLIPLSVLLLAACAATTESEPVPATTAAVSEEDPYLWLEEIQGERALAQVEQWNRRTESDLSRSEGFETRRQRALAILNDERQIAIPDQIL